MNSRRYRWGLQLDRSFVVVGGILDDLDYFIDVLKTDLQTEQDVLALLSLGKVESGSSCCDVLAVLEVVVEHLLEVQAHRTAFDKSQIVDVEVGLKLGVLEKVIDHDIGNCILLELDDDSDSVTSGFVSDCRDIP